MMTGFPLLQGFTPQGAQRLLERGEVREFATGELLFNEGDPPAFAVLVLDGKVQVYIEREGDDMILTDVGHGTILGELAVLCGIPRAASVRVREKDGAAMERPGFSQFVIALSFALGAIFKESLRTLVDKERLLIDSIARLSRGNDKPSE